MQKRILAIFVAFLVLPSVLLAADRPTFAVVLSGGGARGLAHISVLEELERRGIVPDYVVGTSMGALVGAFYAAGYAPSEIREIVMQADLMDIFLHVHSRSSGLTLRTMEDPYLANIATIDFSESEFGSANGIIDDQYVAAFLRSNLSKVLDIDDFDDLPIPFRCIGTDLVTGEELVFGDGSIYDAIRGSMSLPVIFRPARTSDGKYVIDGGMMNNLPCDVARDLGADIVLAVDVNNAMGRRESLDDATLETLTGASFQFLDLITQVNSQENYDEADWVLIPAVDNISTMAFNEREEIMSIGDECVMENMDVFDEIEKRLSGRSYESHVDYSDLPDIVFKGFIYPGLEKYKPYFDFFTGAVADKDTIELFERTIEYIKEHERLKNIYYNIYDGIVYVVGEPYQSLSSSVSLGFNGSVNFIFNSLGKDISFSFNPKLDVFFNFKAGKSGTILVGVEAEKLVRVFSTYFLPIVNTFDYYAHVSFGVGELSMLSMQNRVASVDTDDFRLRLETGLSYRLNGDWRFAMAFKLDYSHLAAIANPIDDVQHEVQPAIDYIAPTFEFTASCSDYIGNTLYDTGFEGDLKFEIMARSPLVYGIEFGVDSILPSLIPNSRFLLSAEAETHRGSGDYLWFGDFYRIGNTGLITRDYLEVECGGRVIFTDRVFLDVAFYVEGLEKNPDEYYNRTWIMDSVVSYIPFSAVNDVLFGCRLGVGFMTSFGNIVLDFKANHNGQLFLGLSFK